MIIVILFIHSCIAMEYFLDNTVFFFQIQDDCTALIKENAAISAQVVELRKQIDMVSPRFSNFFLCGCVKIVVCIGDNMISSVVWRS